MFDDKSSHSLIHQILLSCTSGGVEDGENGWRGVTAMGTYESGVTILACSA